MAARLPHHTVTFLKRHLTLPQSWVDWLALGTIVLVAFFAYSFYQPDDQRRWAMLALMVLFLSAQVWPPETPVEQWKHSKREHVRMALLILLTQAMVALKINFTAIIILYFILSGRALFLFPNRTGYAWVFLLGALTTLQLSYLFYPGWFYGMLNGLGTTCGYVFVGSAANAQRRAEQASAESARLLQELQIAHQQLQAYAAHAETLAVAEERNRLAREMHDTLGHHLTVAAVQLEGAQKLVERDPVKATKIIGTVREQVLEGLSELRRTVAALRTPLEEELPLRAALSHLTGQFMEATGIQTALILPAALPELPTNHRQALYRAAQEALTNIQRHAKARHARVEVTAEDDSTILIRITDDGIGMGATAATNGYGLHGLAERATQLGGALAIQPHTGGGTQLLMRLPLPRSAVEDQTTSANNGGPHG